MWAGIDYFPSQPSDAIWRNMSAQLRAQGDRVGLLASGFWWVVRRKQSSNGPAFNHTDEMLANEDMLVQTASGKRTGSS